MPRLRQPLGSDRRKTSDGRSRLSVDTLSAETSASATPESRSLVGSELSPSEDAVRPASRGASAASGNSWPTLSGSSRASPRGTSDGSGRRYRSDSNCDGRSAFPAQLRRITVMTPRLADAMARMEQRVGPEGRKLRQLRRELGIATAPRRKLKSHRAPHALTSALRRKNANSPNFRERREDGEPADAAGMRLTPSLRDGAGVPPSDHITLGYSAEVSHWHSDVR